MTYSDIKRKVFVTYSYLDDQTVGRFLNRWTYREGVFVPKVLGVSDKDDFIDSANPDYVMSQIHEDISVILQSRSF